jgi:hypothetical protein
MRKHCKNSWGLVALMTVVGFGSCKHDKETEQLEAATAKYFSVRQFMYDEVKYYSGPEFTITQVIIKDGKSDTSYFNSLTFDWTEIVKTFAESDITTTECIGHYTYSQFEDKESMTENLFFRAVDDDMVTQKLMVAANYFTGKIKGIFIETSYRTPLWETEQKLLYRPKKMVQIQRYNYPLIGKKTSLIEQYFFSGM